MKPACDLARREVLGSLANDPVTDSMPPGLPRQIGELRSCRPLGAVEWALYLASSRTKLGGKSHSSSSQPSFGRSTNAAAFRSPRCERSVRLSQSEQSGQPPTTLARSKAPPCWSTEFIDGLRSGKIGQHESGRSVIAECLSDRPQGGRSLWRYCEPNKVRTIAIVKPSNHHAQPIGEVKLLDLGLARSATTVKSRSSRDHRTGKRWAPRFTSHGTSHAISRNVDISWWISTRSMHAQETADRAKAPFAQGSLTRRRFA